MQASPVAAGGVFLLERLPTGVEGTGFHRGNLGNG